MGSNIIELAKLGHERAAELKASCGAVDVRSLAQLISDLATQLEVQHVRSTNMAVQLANAESKCRELAAESAGLKELIEQHANSVAVCPNCSHEEPSETDDIVALYRSMETPATDVFLAEVRASAIPEGYALVPQQIFLEPSDIELICSQCGDGHESGHGDFTDGLLWVGNIQRDDGSIVHGLHISSADYTEEGGVTVCEFAAQLRKGV
ncbi:hypothetical protein DN342_01695 [Salmonella enterica subsp. enterica serovar Enteritidis]|nr:hypothetical protein [Salmonella enterica subsp. enterica serovar Enteritidis]EGU4332988.1 hypothetical protein [Salmonella enterica]EGX1466388.1 hypothetical protein [Salmonella enterica]